MKKEHQYWDQFLPYAIFAFNTSYNNRTGFTPFYINHGFEANLPGQLPMAMHHQEATKEITISPSSYCAEVLTKFQTCFQLVLHVQNLNAASMKHTNVQDVPKYFSVGDEVLLFSPVLHKHTPKTFTEFWIGPYTITRQISPVVFEIQKNDNPENKDTVHVSRLKLKRTQV